LNARAIIRIWIADIADHEYEKIAFTNFAFDGCGGRGDYGRITALTAMGKSSAVAGAARFGNPVARLRGTWHELNDDIAGTKAFERKR
jgi:hypothetical protein